MDPVNWRGAERLLIVIGAIGLAYMGFKLYLNGVDKGRVSGTADLKFGKVALAGAGPGIGFMFMGAIILAIAVFYGGASIDETIPAIENQIKAVKETVDRHTQLLSSNKETEFEKFEKFPTMEYRDPAKSDTPKE